jgi:hypothetical protein
MAAQVFEKRDDGRPILPAANRDGSTWSDEQLHRALLASGERLDPCPTCGDDLATHAGAAKSADPMTDFRYLTACPGCGVEFTVGRH